MRGNTVIAVMAEGRVFQKPPRIENFRTLPSRKISKYTPLIRLEVPARKLDLIQINPLI